MSCRDCSWIAATTSGWQWPTFETEKPASMSTYSLPSASHTRAPSPRTIAGGQSKSAKPTGPVDSCSTIRRRISFDFGPYGERSTRASSDSGDSRILPRCAITRSSNPRFAIVCSLSRDELVVAQPLLPVERHERAVQHALGVLAAGVDADGLAELRDAARLVDVPVQCERRLVALDDVPH